MVRINPQPPSGRPQRLILAASAEPSAGGWYLVVGGAVPIQDNLPTPLALGSVQAPQKVLHCTRMSPDGAGVDNMLHGYFVAAG
eukprot:COSAG01_NODE_1936_length_8861_cov_27.526364_5_plen_84_part_00